MKNQLSIALVQISANPKTVKITLAFLALISVAIPAVFAFAGPIDGGS